MHRLVSLLTFLVLLIFLTSPPAVAQDVTTEDYIVFMKPLVGSWKIISESDGEAISGTMTYELAPNGHCFLARYRGAGFPNVQTVEGYNPAAKKHTVTGYGGDGSFASITVDWGAHLRRGKTLTKGTTGKQDGRFCGKDGSTTTITATVKCTTLERGKVVLEYSDRIANGKPMSDMKLTLERK